MSSSSSSSDDESSSSSSSKSTSKYSTASTGQFSCSGESFSSASTFVPPEPCPVQKFGEPTYTYFWIENKSKNNPKLSYYWNYKSNAVVWNRPVSKSVPLPFYTSWEPRRQDQLDDDDDDDDCNENVNVSDSENDFEKQKRIAIKRRNKKLVIQDLEKSIEVLSVKKTVKSRRMLETFWKLHRLPGETLKDVKTRLLKTSVDPGMIKTEVKDDGYDTQNSLNMSIKQEPVYEANDDSCMVEEQTVFDEGNENNDSSVPVQHEEDIVKDEDSESDPENVSFLIKQEFENTCGSTGEESKDEDEEYEQQGFLEEDFEKDSDNEIISEESEEEEEDDSDEKKQFNCNGLDGSQTNDSTTDGEIQNCNRGQLENDFEVLSLADFLEVDIDEEDQEDVCVANDSTMNNDSAVEEKINWTFEKSAESANNSLLTSSIVTNIYHVPEMKRMEKKRLQLLKKQAEKRKKQRMTRKKVPKLIIKTSPSFHIKQEPVDADSDQPIVCDMYGTRTVNYNHPPKVKLPTWQAYSRLSDSEGNSSGNEFEKRVPKLKLRLINPLRACASNEEPTANKKQAGALELKNWFPKKKSKKRKFGSKSDSSWCESDISGYSEVDDVAVTLVKIKKEKKSSDSEKEEEEEKRSSRSEEEEEFHGWTKRANPCYSGFNRFDEKILQSIKKEKVDEAEENTNECTQETMEEVDRKPGWTTPPIPDLNLVKIERRSSESQEMQDPAADANAEIAEKSVKEENVCEAEKNSSSASSSSSSSGFSSSSSSSSSSDEESDANDEQPATKEEDL